MTELFPVFFAAIMLLLLSVLTADLGGIEYRGRDYWLNGVNSPWNSFGADAGEHEEWGRLYDPEWFSDFFTRCRANGINCVRHWIHCDGRASPEFDDRGFVTGLDPTFLAEISDDNHLVQRSRHYNHPAYHWHPNGRG